MNSLYSSKNDIREGTSNLSPSSGSSPLLSVTATTSTFTATFAILIFFAARGIAVSTPLRSQCR